MFVLAKTREPRPVGVLAREPTYLQFASDRNRLFMRIGHLMHRSIFALQTKAFFFFGTCTRLQHRSKSLLDGLVNQYQLNRNQHSHHDKQIKIGTHVTPLFCDSITLTKTCLPPIFLGIKRSSEADTLYKKSYLSIHKIIKYFEKQ